MRTCHLRSGKSVPILGQGTWRMAEDVSKWSQEIEALRTGLDLGMSLIDTAEIYAEGRSEKLVAEAIGERRKEAFLVTKVAPEHATRLGTIEACERSLRRLQTDYIDLYLLHWRGAVPLAETLEAFQILKHTGKILDYGVSNFDISDMKESLALLGGDGIVTDQVLYNLNTRNIEWDLLPWCKERKISIMAYTPFGYNGELLRDPLLKLIASRHSATPVQVALAWLLRQKNLIAIPKASSAKHVIENHAALELKLTHEDLKELDRVFPPPARKTPLEII